MKVLVTGASGFIASHIVKILLEKGHSVRGTVRNAAKVERYAHLTAIANECKGQLEFVSCDLSKDDGWSDAVRDCEVVIHTASPVPAEQPENAEELIVPARDGALRVLRACANTKGGVRRVVLTSSTSAVSAGRLGEKNDDGTDHLFSPEDHTKLSDANPYEQSKTLAEKAAWEYVNGLADDEKFELVCVNPGFVLGPTLKPELNTTLTPIKRIMCRDDPGSVKLWFNAVDVRDVAAAHVAAMDAPNAPGNRYILCSPKGCWMSDISMMLKEEFGPKGYSIATMTFPYPLIWLLGRCDASIRTVLPWIGLRHLYDISASERDLGFKVTDIRETVRDCAYSLIQHGIVPNRIKPDQQ